jgi:hypothetical protein
MARLTGKVAFITGAGNGIGRATAILFAREGAKVAIVEIDARAGDETAHLAGNEAIAIRADVTDPDSLAHVIRGPFSEITSFVSRGTDGLQTRRWREAVMSEPVSDGQIPGKYREFRALNVYQLAERRRTRAR